jgi:protein-tyrosine kinase
LGSILVDAGRLNRESVEDIVLIQREHKLMFGEAAIKLGLLDKHDIDFALSRQFDCLRLLPGESGISEEVVVLYRPGEIQVESLRRLRSKITSICFLGNKRKRLAIVSPGTGEGRSFVTANLAVLISQIGKRTLIIDADMRNPRQHLLFDLPMRDGLSKILSGRATIGAVQPVPKLPNLSVLSAGPQPPNAQELLSRPVFNLVLGELEQHFDAILIDTPAAMHSSDCMAVAAAAQSALIVLRRDMSRIADLERTLRDLAWQKILVTGSVINAF